MRVALGVEYDGSHYRGWQQQAGCATVQADLEAALAQVAAVPVMLVCAGRTDAGVHATGQVVHFDTRAQRPLVAWREGGNRYLPPTIRLRWARQVPEDFHARFSALSRCYRYIIDNHSWRPALWHSGISWIRQPLDAKLMHQAGQALIGEHDFSAFRASQCQSNSPWRRITQLSVSRRGNYLVLQVTANAFVHHMVRNIVGSLLLVGSGQRPTSWIAELLAGRDRRRSAATAKAQGLYLVRVTYPEGFQLPITPLGPLWFSDDQC
ncbi:MAG: tRNA pseudouridine(38-40) synthase TruA [Candidatus Symbiodolus clandestinus]